MKRYETTWGTMAVPETHRRMTLDAKRLKEAQLAALEIECFLGLEKSMRLGFAGLFKKRLTPIRLSVTTIGQ